MTAPFVTGYRCMVGDEVHRGPLAYTCPDHGREGILDLEFDLEAVREAWRRRPLRDRPATLERYRELLPLDPGDASFPVPVGGTPLWLSPRLAAEAGVRRLWIKDDGRGPTGSLKDRASTVGVAAAAAAGAGRIACASTGNAASSLAGAAAAVGMPSVIFVPERAPEPKLAQLVMFGAVVFQVEGTYEAAYDLCEAACERFGWANRNCAVNPVLVEGKKTAGLEIAEALAASPPDWVVVSVGDGCTVAGVAKGLLQFAAAGATDRVPRVLGVQAAGSAPLLEAFRSGKDLVPSGAETMADSIAVGTPRNWRKAVRYLRRTSGEMVAVEDAAIAEAMRVFARHGGCYAEPASAAALAGLLEAVSRGIVRSGESVVVLSTGSGLKDTATALRVAGRPRRIPPSLETVERVLAEPAGS